MIEERHSIVTIKKENSPHTPERSVSKEGSTKQVEIRHETPPRPTANSKIEQADSKPTETSSSKKIPRPFETPEQIENKPTLRFKKKKIKRVTKNKYQADSSKSITSRRLSSGEIPPITQEPPIEAESPNISRVKVEKEQALNDFNQTQPVNYDEKTGELYNRLKGVLMFWCREIALRKGRGRRKRRIRR